MATAHNEVMEEPGSSGRTLTLDMLDAVGASIVRGEYESQAFPTEAELTVQHGVSRSVTREAVKMITAKGLLMARPKAGTFVQPLDSWNLFDVDVMRWLMAERLSATLLRQVNELRLAVEPLAASFAAQRATPAQVAAIRGALRRMQEAADGRGDPLAADIDFHIAVLRAASNPFIAQFRELVTIALRTSIRISNRQAGGRECIPDHQAVYDAIAEGDPANAKLAMGKLIQDVLSYLDRAPDGL